MSNDPWNLIAVFLGLLAGFLFLRLLAQTHLRDRALLNLFHRAATLRRKQEEIERRIGTAPLLPRYRRFETGLRAILTREGIQPPAA